MNRRTVDRLALAAALILLAALIIIGARLVYAGPSLPELCAGPAPSPGGDIDRRVLDYIDRTRAEAGLPPLARSPYAAARMQFAACQAARQPRAWTLVEPYLDSMPVNPRLNRATRSPANCAVGVWHFAAETTPRRAIGGAAFVECEGTAL